MNLTDFIGRFHPLVVHLPIGILIMAVFLDLLSRKAKHNALLPSVVWLYGLGALSAIGASGTGYLLSLSGEYEVQAIDNHKWFGMGLAVVACIVFALKYYDKTIPTLGGTFANLLILALVAVTGHLGGNLTHGTDYLTKYMPQPLKGWVTGEEEQLRVKIENVQEAKVYQDIIAPIFKDKCYGCHGPTKKKGKLRLDNHEGIIKGGESKLPSIVAFKPTESEIIRRALLSPNNDEHMPPKEKAQLTRGEIKLISWWIEQGGGVDDLVKNLIQPEAITPLLVALEKGSVDDENQEALQGSIFPADLPDDSNIASPNVAAINKLREQGVVVLPSGIESPFIEVNYINVDSVNSETIKLLAPLTKNIVRLKLSYASIDAADIELISAMKNLMRLYLDYSTINDKGLEKLAKLDNLVYLNLVNTAVSTEGIKNLNTSKSLKKLFLHGCNVDLSQLKDSKFIIDVGGYTLPKMNNDSLNIVSGY